MGPRPSPIPPAWPIIDRPAREELAAAISRAGTVVVAGEPGVGKSRLVNDLTRGRQGVVHITGTRTRPVVPGAAVSALVQQDDHLIALAGLVAALRRVVLREKIHTIVVDDAHEVDEISAAALHHCCAVGSLRLVLVLRSDRLLPDALRSTARRDDTRWVTVPRATAGDVETILRRALRPAVDTAAVEHLRRASDGNLFHLRHLVEGSIRSGTLVAEDGLWVLHGPPERTPILDEVVRASFARLTPKARELADLIAVAGPVSSHLLAGLDAESAAEELEKAGFTTPADRFGSVDLAYSVYRDHLTAELGAARRRRLLSRLLTAVPNTPGHSAHAVRLAIWRHESGAETLPDDDVAAAGLALTGRQPELALTLATRVWLEPGPDPRTRGEAGLLVARCAEQLGDFRRACDVYRQIADSDVEPTLRAKAITRLAECLRGPLDDQAGARRVLAEAATVRSGDSTRLLDVQVAVGLLCDGDLAGALAITSPLLDDPRADAEVVAAATVVASQCLLRLDRPGEAVELVNRSAGLGGRADVVTVTTPDSAVLTGACAAARLGRVQTAREITDRMSRQELTLSAPAAGAFVDFARGSVSLLSDRPADAVAEFGRCTTAFRRSDMPGYAEWSAICGLVAATDLGTDHLGGVFDSLTGTRRTGYGLYTPELLRAEARILAATGLPGRARKAWRRAFETAASRSDWLSATETAMDLLCAGELDELGSVVGGLPSPCSPTAIAVHASASASRGNTSELAGIADDLAHSRPVRAADIHALAARIADAAGRPCAAHSTRARELARTVPGLTRPAGWLPVELSSREEQIARLASTGLTNRDIAGALGISPKTVENHLGNAFRELGVTGRTELRAIFRDSETPGGSDQR